MKYQKLKNTALEVSQVAYGCMQMGGAWEAGEPSDDVIKKTLQNVEVCLEYGINFFDHADIYCLGRSEKAFSNVWDAGLVKREDVILQSKCGIRFAGDPMPDSPHRYDFSYEHIVWSVDQILKRLKTDYLDILLLHRPDALVECDEVAKAFDEIHKAGKVRYFGVSNHNTLQIELLKKSVNQPLVANQIQLSPLHANSIDAGTVAGYGEQGIATRGEAILEYCQLNDIAVQAFGVAANGYLSGRAVPDDKPSATHATKVVADIAAKYNVTSDAIVVAWTLRHPSHIQAIFGTTNNIRIKDICMATEVELTREEWYRIYIAGRGQKLP